MAAVLLALLASAGVPARANPLRLVTYSVPEALGQQGNRDAISTAQALSGDGRFLVFSSASNNWLAHDTDHLSDVFLVDAARGTTTRLPCDNDDGGIKGWCSDAVISADGRWIAFSRTTPAGALPATATLAIQLVERETGTIRTIPNMLPPQGYSAGALSLSADGEVLVFSSRSSFVADDVDTRTDHYAWRRSSGSFTRLTRRADEVPLLVDFLPRPVLSADGRFVAFNAEIATPSGTGPRQAFLVNLDSGIVAPLVAADGAALDVAPTSLSEDGRLVAFDATARLSLLDRNAATDAYLLDRDTGAIELLSVGPDQSSGNSSSYAAVLSGDGRTAVFASVATNFHAGARALSPEIYRRDRVAGTTTLLSRPWDGELPSQIDAGHDARNMHAGISRDGGTVTFVATDSRLVANDNNRRRDVFRVDLPSGRITRASVSRAAPRAGGSNAPTFNFAQSFINSSGDTVHFSTMADHLVPRYEGTIFRHDLASGITRVAVISSLPQPPTYTSFGATWQLIDAVSDDGSRVLFHTDNMPHMDLIPVLPFPQGPFDLWLHRTDGLPERLDESPVLGQFPSLRYATMDARGRRVASVFSGWLPDGRESQGVFVHELAAHTARRVDVGTDGGAPDADCDYTISVSRNGRFLVFGSNAGNLVPDGIGARHDLYLHDLDSRVTQRIVHPSNGSSLLGRFGGNDFGVSDDGQVLAFVADAAPNGGDNHLWRLDRSRGELHHIASMGTYGGQLSLSADGQRLVFTSRANLLFETNNRDQVYAYDHRSGRTWLAGTDETGAPGNADSYAARISGDGSTISFTSAATNWRSTPQFGGDANIYVRKLEEPALFRDGFE